MSKDVVFRIHGRLDVIIELWKVKGFVLASRMFEDLEIGNYKSAVHFLIKEGHFTDIEEVFIKNCLACYDELEE